MCEPYHSIVQFPDQDDDGGQTETRLQFGLGKLYDIGKKISSWFHFSRMGMGHSESITDVMGRDPLSIGRSQLQLPPMTRYEAAWWKREVHRDGTYRGHEFDANFALEAAEAYAKKVSIGDLRMLRRFLETTLQKTDRISMYVQSFFEMLNPTGRDLLAKDLNDMFGTTRWGAYNLGGKAGRFNNATSEERASLIRLVMGYTRRKKLLIPVWTDQ